MFIKWVKDITREWWNIWGDLIKGAGWFWVFLSWLFVIVDALQDTTKELNEFARFFRYKAIPVMIVTGIIPSLFVLTCYVGNWLYRLYLDYRYFAENGKRKRSEEYNPYRNSEEES